jgi:hypothetical protein
MGRRNNKHPASELAEFRFFSANPAFAGSSMPAKQSVSSYIRIAPDLVLPIPQFFPSVSLRAIRGYKKFPPMVLPTIILP